MSNHASRGQVLPLVALTLTGLFGFSGLAVDVGFWEYQENAQQTATDAAAMGAAQELGYKGCPNTTEATATAQQDAASNGYSSNGSINVIVNVQNPPASGAYSGSPCAVYVQISTAKVSSWFSRLFGFGNGATITTQAVATLTSNAAGCIYMLQTSQNTNFNGSTVNTPHCAILLNGSANFLSSKVDAAMIGEVNYSGSNNSGTFTQASPQQILPVADPCMEISGCAYLTNNPPSTSPCNGSYSGNGTLSPGCYKDLNLNGATVTFSTGTYVFTGGPNLNGANITANGATIYIPASTIINFNKVSSLTLAPPSTGNTAGVSYYQVKSNSADVNFNGASTVASGLIYAPSSQINYNNSSNVYTVLVGAFANLNLSAGSDFATPAPGAAIIAQRAILAQ